MFSLLELPIMDRFLLFSGMYIDYHVAVCGAIMVYVTVKLLEFWSYTLPYPLN